MFEVLSGGFKKAKEKLRGLSTLDEENIKEALELVRVSLLDADVEYRVSQEFITRVKDKALGTQVKLTGGKGSKKQKVRPVDHFIKICQDELEQLLGEGDSSLYFPQNELAIIMMVGLQGTGKTTSTGKLANYLRHTHKRTPLLVAADVYRPAAKEQLRVLGERINVPVFTQESNDAVAICQAAKQEALNSGHDTLLLDTAGRLTIDEKLMEELRTIKSSVKPTDILLVCDAMMGQDAVTTAVNFHQALSLSGAIMTKLDGDARGGAAMSIKQVTGVSIKFLGMGEELDRLEEFRPQGLASRILGQGDIVGLMQDFERVVKEDKEEEAIRMMQGKLNLKDYAEQISSLQQMGSMSDLVDKLPMRSMLPEGANIDEKELKKINVIISSMTEKERMLPDIIDNSRVNRISKGCGYKQNDVQNMLNNFRKMREAMGSIGNSLGFMKKIPGLSQLTKLKQMKDMLANPQNMQAMLGGGGIPGYATPSSLKNTRPTVDRDKIKKARRAAKAARRKNRRK